jgi:photosystem II CP43 chlorophyll apoprotein
VIILTICLSIYGSVSFKKEFRSDRLTYATSNPSVPDSLKTVDGWSQFSGAFLVGGIGGAIFAYLILDNLSILQALASGKV